MIEYAGPERRSPNRDVEPESAKLATTYMNRAVRAALHEVGEMWRREQAWLQYFAGQRASA